MKTKYTLWVTFTYSQDGRSQETAHFTQEMDTTDWWLFLNALDKSPDVVEMWCKDENDQRVTPFRGLEKLNGERA